MPDYLGEIAYNAYCEERKWKSFNGDPLPHWKQQSDDLRKAWIEAAQAVAEKISISQSIG